MAEKVSEKMDELFILDKIFAKYQQEVARSARLEAKTSSYYMIWGIYFAAFLVIVPALAENALLLRGSEKLVFVLLVGMFTTSFLIFFFISIWRLHEKYKPTTGPDFVPEDNWELLLGQNKDMAITLMRNNLTSLIKEFGKRNEQTAVSLKLVNNLCIVAAITIATCFILLLVLLCISKGGLFYAC